MWENELIMFRFGFLLLIGIFLLLLGILIKLHHDHRELVDTVRHLPTHSRCEEDSPNKEGGSR